MVLCVVMPSVSIAKMEKKKPQTVMLLFCFTQFQGPAAAVCTHQAGRQHLLWAGQSNPRLKCIHPLSRKSKRIGQAPWALSTHTVAHSGDTRSPHWAGRMCSTYAGTYSSRENTQEKLMRTHTSPSEISFGSTSPREFGHPYHQKKTAPLNFKPLKSCSL